MYDIQQQFSTLVNDLAVGGTILPIILTVIPSKWDNDTKKVTTFIVCLIYTFYSSYIRGYLAFNWHDIGLVLVHLITMVLASKVVYDGVVKPVGNKLSQTKALKLIKNKRNNVKS